MKISGADRGCDAQCCTDRGSFPSSPHTWDVAGDADRAEGIPADPANTGEACVGAKDGRREKGKTVLWGSRRCPLASKRPALSDDWHWGPYTEEIAEKMVVPAPGGLRRGLGPRSRAEIWRAEGAGCGGVPGRLAREIGAWSLEPKACLSHSGCLGIRTDLPLN
ncbi:hypothetical protein NDU88_005958 [Pleurodeles waltl]|uniref:Uncharacterized protein n=1 Tax=Pleurodeles waltl TaxID=8319 RepID=A0AAV7WD02_PLEWA|nr:hypothetical protein NDU88_005958 [Pleurodeles waltl]